MFDVSGRKVMLTGGTGGIGRTIAKTLVDRGATVTISGTNKTCLLYTSPSPRDRTRSRMPSSA